MQFYNPTGNEFEVRAAGKFFKVPKFGTIDVWEAAQIRVLGYTKKSSAYDTHGLVAINYNDENQKKYDSFKDYKVAKAKEGLKKYIAKCQEVYLYEREAVKDIAHNSGGEADKELVNPEKFLEKKAEGQKWLDMLEKGSHPVYEEFNASNVDLNQFSPEQLEALKAKLSGDSSEKKAINTGRKRGRSAKVDNESTDHGRHGQAEA